MIGVSYLWTLIITGMIYGVILGVATGHDFLEIYYPESTWHTAPILLWLGCTMVWSVRLQFPRLPVGHIDMLTDAVMSVWLTASWIVLHATLADVMPKEPRYILAAIGTIGSCVFVQVLRMRYGHRAEAQVLLDSLRNGKVN